MDCQVEVYQQVCVCVCVCTCVRYMCVIQNMHVSHYSIHHYVCTYVYVLYIPYTVQEM